MKEVTISVTDEQYEQIQSGMSPAEALVPHGKWMQVHEIDGVKKGACSNCFKVRPVDNFCPCCGSRMNG